MMGSPSPSLGSAVPTSATVAISSVAGPSLAGPSPPPPLSSHESSPPGHESSSPGRESSPPGQPSFFPLCAPPPAPARLLAPPSTDPRLLTPLFVKCDSAAEEEVLTRQLGVRRVHMAELMRDVVVPRAGEHRGLGAFRV